MSNLSVAAVEAWCQSLERLFEKEAENGVKPAWVVVSAAKYEPENRKYKRDKQSCPPIVLTSLRDIENLPARLSELAEGLSSTQELALNTDVACCWSDGTFTNYDMNIYDGAPGLSDNEARKKGWTVLKTKGGHHFYREIESAFLPTAHQDGAWISFKRCGCGYIRVTHNIKGHIITLKGQGPKHSTSSPIPY